MQFLLAATAHLADLTKTIRTESRGRRVTPTVDFARLTNVVADHYNRSLDFLICIAIRGYECLRAMD